MEFCGISDVVPNSSATYGSTLHVGAATEAIYIGFIATITDWSRYRGIGFT